MQSIKTCDSCGIPIARTASRGQIKKLCAPCYAAKESARSKAFRLANKQRISDLRKEIYREKRAIYLEVNKEKIQQNKNARKEKSEQTRITWIKSNTEKIRLYIERGAPRRRERAKEYHSKYSKSLADPYIKHLLVMGTKLSKKEIPQSLIDLKRVQVQITRALKEINK